MSNTKEYKDKSGEWRLTHKAVNGNITLASTEGYKNKKDMQESMINACIETLEYFRSIDCLSEKQQKEIIDLSRMLEIY